MRSYGIQAMPGPYAYLSGTVVGHANFCGLWAKAWNKADNGYMLCVETHSLAVQLTLMWRLSSKRSTPVTGMVGALDGQLLHHPEWLPQLVHNHYNVTTGGCFALWYFNICSSLLHFLQLHMVTYVYQPIFSWINVSVCVYSLSICLGTLTIVISLDVLSWLSIKEPQFLHKILH